MMKKGTAQKRLSGEMSPEDWAAWTSEMKEKYKMVVKDFV
jgi:hypothetical protein